MLDLFSFLIGGIILLFISCVGSFLIYDAIDEYKESTSKWEYWVVGAGSLLALYTGTYIIHNILTTI